MQVIAGDAAALPAAMAPGTREEAVFLTLTVAGQWCAVPVLAVRDVLGPHAITRIPLAPPDVAGSLNLRGRIVTALDLRLRLGLPPRQGEVQAMSVVVEQAGELYALLVDQVGEVMALPAQGFAPHPPTLDALWRDVSSGVHRQEERLVIVLDVGRVLAIG